MSLRNLPIRRKLMVILLVTSAVVMLLMRGAFFTSEYLNFRSEKVHQLSTVAQIIATNSASAVLVENKEAASEALAALQADRNIVAAALFDLKGQLFARYPAALPTASLPSAPDKDGYHFVHSHVVGFLPVSDLDGRLGTLYVDLDTGPAFHDWLSVSLQIALAVMAVVVLVAYSLSYSLQRQISQPIVALAEKAQAISDHRDYSVRATKLGDDEIGRLTDAFNQMLGEIEVLNRILEGRVTERTAQLEIANTELKRRRAVFENLFESLPGLFLVLTPEFKIVNASDAYLKATMTTRAAVIGRDLFEVFPDNPDELNATGVSNLRASLERVKQSAAADTLAIQRYDVRRPDGMFEKRYWSPVNSPLLGADHRVEYLIHRVEDVTDFVHQKPAARDSTDLKAKMEKMQAEVFHSSQKILATNQQLREANEELESFSYSVSHDLRAPLRHIDGFAGLLAKSDGAQISERGRSHLAHISESARRMGMLIDDLLLFCRMGRSDMNLSPVGLQQVVEEAVRALQKQEIGERAITWKIGILPVVDVDRSMVRQVFINLISNAVKYTRPRDPAEIEVGCFSEPNEKVFFVRDNGVGFEMQYAQKLFGVFQRLHRAEEFEGTGIGLANVRRIISRHGGRTWAESVLNEGATFYFSLPEKTK